MKGADALRTCAEELVQCVFPALMRVVREAGISNPCFSYDHAKPHEAAAPFFNIERGTPACVPMAAKSPDMNRPAEHVIANIKSEFIRRLQQGAAAGLTAKKAQALLQRVFHETVTAANVEADARGLVDTMRVIAAPKGAAVTLPGGRQVEGSGGDWAPRGLR